MFTQKRIVSQARHEMAAQERNRASPHYGSPAEEGWGRRSKAKPMTLTRNKKTK